MLGYFLYRTFKHLMKPVPYQKQNIINISEINFTFVIVVHLTISFQFSQQLQRTWVISEFIYL